MFIRNFQGTYEYPSTAETLRTIKQKHNESLREYVKRFCNARNGISYIQDIEIINAFCDDVSDLKTMEEIAVKKPKTVANLLTVADVCIEASEARARLLESRGKDPEEGMIGKSIPLNKEIRRTRERSGAKSITLMDMIWKSAKLFWIAKRCRLQQHRHPKIPAGEISDGDKHMVEINMIFRGSMSITSKTQGKKLQH
jgi:hypothetical protein